MDGVFQCAGPDCNRTLTRSGTGRPPKYCGPNCRKAAQRARDRVTEAAQRQLAELAGARSTATRTWRPLEETSHELEELACAVLAYAAGSSRADLEGKLTELRETARQLEELAMTYYGAAERASQLGAAPPASELRDRHNGGTGAPGRSRNTGGGPLPARPDDESDHTAGHGNQRRQPGRHRPPCMSCAVDRRNQPRAWPARTGISATV